MSRVLFLVCFFIIPFTLSCRKQVGLQYPDFEPIPVLNSYLVADSMIRVHLSMAGALDTVPLPLVENAVVSFFVNDSMAGNLYPTGNGYYETEIRAKAGSIYRFEAEVPNFPTVNAWDTLPVPVPILFVERIDHAGLDDQGNNYPAVLITFPVNPKKIQYLQVEAKLNFKENQWDSWQIINYNDPVLLAEGLPMAVFSTACIQDSTYTLKIDYDTMHWTCDQRGCRMLMYPICIELRSISYSYYQYLKQLYLYNSGRFPEFQFAPYKAFPLYSNVNNGMGVVAGYSSYLSDVIIPED